MRCIKRFLKGPEVEKKGIGSGVATVVKISLSNCSSPSLAPHLPVYGLRV